MLNKLSSREKEFVKWFVVTKGDYNKMAELMIISKHTLLTYRNNIFRKLLVSDKCELMYYIMKNIPQLGNC